MRKGDKIKKLYLILVFAPFLFSMDYAQSLSDYISEIKGDTLIVKDYYDMNSEDNSLFYALTLDTLNVPEGRVYELKTNGYYPLLNSPVTSENQHTVIIGSDQTPLVNNKNSSPPLI